VACPYCGMPLDGYGNKQNKPSPLPLG